jgi:hypothetical protein
MKETKRIASAATAAKKNGRAFFTCEGEPVQRVCSGMEGKL